MDNSWNAAGGSHNASTQMERLSLHARCLRCPHILVFNVWACLDLQHFPRQAATRQWTAKTPKAQEGDSVFVDLPQDAKPPWVPPGPQSTCGRKGEMSLALFACCLFDCLFVCHFVWLFVCFACFLGSLFRMRTMQVCVCVCDCRKAMRKCINLGARPTIAAVACRVRRSQR